MTLSPKKYRIRHLLSMEKVDFTPGDTVRVNVKVKESGKERLQAFEGVVLSIRGKSPSQTFTVRKIGSAGIGVERIWPINSPSIQSIEIKKKSKTRRAKLYYLRGRKGKAALEV